MLGDVPFNISDFHFFAVPVENSLETTFSSTCAPQVAPLRILQMKFTKSKRKISKFERKSFKEPEPNRTGTDRQIRLGTEPNRNRPSGRFQTSPRACDLLSSDNRVATARTCATTGVSDFFSPSAHTALRASSSFSWPNRLRASSPPAHVEQTALSHRSFVLFSSREQPWQCLLVLGLVRNRLEPNRTENRRRSRRNRGTENRPLVGSFGETVPFETQFLRSKIMKSCSIVNEFNEMHAVCWCPNVSELRKHVCRTWNQQKRANFKLSVNHLSSWTKL